MTRGSTPTHTFKCALDPELIYKVRVLYAQNGKLVLRKENADCTIDGQNVSVKLTQEETLAFREGLVEIQLRVLTRGGDSIPSKVHTENVAKLLEDEVFE